MRDQTVAGVVRVSAWVLVLTGAACCFGAEPAAVGRGAAGHRAIEPAAPVLPASVVAAMQEGRFAEAELALKAFGEGVKDAGAKEYVALVKGIAQRLGGKGDAARKTFQGAIEVAPKGRWAAKLRMELAGVELASGKVAEAETLARVEAETLLAGDRKDRLAGVYEAFARRLLKPDDLVTPADPKGAYELLAQGRELAKGDRLRSRLLLAMARAGRLANDFGKAFHDYAAYLKEYPKGEDRLEARLELGEAQLAAGQVLQARLTWTDLARDLEDAKSQAEKGADGVRARALFAIASTYQITAPPDDTSMNFGVASLKRFLATYPADSKAVTAAYWIGGAYLARGKSEEAVEAFTRFLKGEDYRAETEDAKRDLVNLSMAATFKVGQVLQGQKKFDEAVAAWKGYLAKYPNGPQSADAQRAILDTQLLTAVEHLTAERYDEARAGWQAFLVQNPLDGRVPEVLFQVGDSFQKEGKQDRAIAAWEPLLSKFPGSEPAAHAQFAIAAIDETEKGDLESAIGRFRKVMVEPWASQARQRVLVMESKTLVVMTPRTFRSGETPHLKVTSRNLEKLTFSAYKLNAEAYFRKKHALENIESLDIGLVAPDAEWTVAVKGYARFKPVSTTYDLTKVEVPGVYVVKVTDEKHLQATTLVVGSDIDAVVKTSRDQILVFAQDMKTGKGRANARVLVAEGEEVVLEATTGADGVLLKNWDKPRAVDCHLAYLVIDGANVAGTELSVPATVSTGLSARAYIYTDRPAYRPGQEAEIRGIVREVSEGQYTNGPKAVYKLEVTDSRGRQIVSKLVTLSEFGTFHEMVRLDGGAPVGSYRVRVYQPGKSDFAGQFEVQSYQLQKIDLSFDLKKTVYFRGETVEGDVVARYQYGAPAAGRAIAVRLPDGRMLHGKTDAAGKYHVTFPTEGFAEEQMLRLLAQLTQDNVATAVNVALAIRAFSIEVGTSRDVYLDGESFQVRATTVDPQGTPSGQTLSAALVKLVTHANVTTEREAARKAVVTDPKTGRGTVVLKSDDEQGGSYLVRVSGTDRFGNPVVADRALTISGKSDDETLRILADRQTYKVGEEATVNLHSRGTGGTALLAWEADKILTYKIVTLAKGNNPVGWAVDGAQFPNFTLTACRMSGRGFDEARLDVRVERDLRVTVKPAKGVVKPGDPVELEVTTVDQLGRPVAAEVSVALVDKSLLAQFNDKLPSIGPFFYDQTRTGAFATISTNTFTYEPETTPVAEAVVEESERQLALETNAAGRGQVLEAANGQVAKNLPMAAPMASAPAAGGGRDLRERKLPQGRFQLGVGASNFHGLQESMEEKKGGMAGLGGDDVLGSGPAVIRNGENIQLGAQDIPVDKSEPGDAQLDDKSDQYKSLSGRREKLGRKSGALAEAGPRERFVETAYWNPSVMTGKDGKATVKFAGPMALSEYRFTARGVTGADTLVGQTTSELTVRKDFFVDLKVPAALTQGDKPRFIGEVHHVGMKGALTAKLVVYAGGKEQVFPKALEVKGDGVDEILFDPFTVPDGEDVRLTLSATMEEAKDELVVEVPVRPWGVQAFASASGTATDDATVFVGLPEGRAYENAEMIVLVSPTLKRLLIELAMGRDVYPLSGRLNRCIFPPPMGTTADRASDLLAATSALKYLRSSKAGGAAPESGRLTDQARGLVSELTAAQNEDGGWAWVGGALQGNARPSERLASAHVVWALSTAEPLGLLTDPKALEKASGYLVKEYGKLGAGDHESRALILHALATRGKANFENANSLNRIRQSLSDPALAYLALTFAALDRGTLASEILDILGPRAKTETVEPGGRSRKYWGSAGLSPWTGSTTETTALVALAYARVKPRAPELEGAVEWLLAHRNGFGWNPHKAKGAALAALADYYARGQGAEDRYNLVVTVNDKEVYRTQVLGGGTSEGKAVQVPRDLLKATDKNRVRFNVEGRGTYGYAVTLTGFTRDFGPDQTAQNRPFLVTQHIFMPAEPELDGKALPIGFDVAVGASYFENWAHQVEMGGRVRVRLDAYRNTPNGQQPWSRDFLVLEDHLPAGGTLVEGSVQTSAQSYELADGVIRFYFAPEQEPGNTYYDVFGYLPGEYRNLPPILSSAYEPGRRHMASAGVYELKVLSPAEAKTDPYKPTPSELYARGKGLFDAGKLGEASGPLEELFNAYTLRDDVAKDAARMLLLGNIKEYSPRKVVQYFEVVKEKAPELVVTFEDLVVIGRAYRDINEFERAYLVWRGVVEASYLEDARVGEVLRQRGKTLEGVAYLLDLWREYPETASIGSDFFGLSQMLALNAGKAISDANMRRELADAEVTRSELFLQSIRLIQAFLALSPRNPLADEASLGLVGNFLELEDYQAVVKLSGRFATLYPKSTFLDSFQYSEALGEFHLGHYDRAVDVAETIAKATYKDAAGADQPSPNKWQAIYILGQIFDARRQPGKALEYYRQVAERFSDAADAVKGFTRKELKLAEVTVVRPSQAPKITEERGGVAVGKVAFRNVAMAQDESEPEPRFPEELKLSYRNIKEADLKVYPVDLMRLYLTRRNLDAIAGIDLAGITPLVERTIKLGDGEDFADKLRKIDLGLKKEGAYLVMVRGDNLYASGIVLVSPIAVEVLEESAGRVRVTVRDAATKDFVPKVLVKVIGSHNTGFISGETDLRGVFVAEGIKGQAAAVARKGLAQYAFYRGTTALGLEKTTTPAERQKPGGDALYYTPSLEENLRGVNGANQMRSYERLQNRFQAAPQGGQRGAAAGGFR